MKLLLTIAALVANGAVQPQQFDLVCTGQQRFDISDPFKPASFRLRVDLDARKWCEDAPPEIHAELCSVLHDVAEVQPSFIAFDPDQTAEQQSMGIVRTHYVDRTTGEYVHYVHDRGPGMIEVKAHCEPAPFSGFPKIQTKF
jgi:hypothetical protein